MQTTISGNRDDPSEPLRILYSIFTGWTPSDYQLYSEFDIAPGSDPFWFSETLTFPGLASGPWSNFQFYPPAHYYFESRSLATHQVGAVTSLHFSYAAHPVPEAGNFGLFAVLGLGLAALRRRR